jgi:hypothetical protein
MGTNMGCAAELHNGRLKAMLEHRHMHRNGSPYDDAAGAATLPSDRPAQTQQDALAAYLDLSA